MLIRKIKEMLDKIGHRFMLFLTIAIAAIMAVNFAWNIYYQQHQSLLELREKANIIGLQYQALRAMLVQEQHLSGDGFSEAVEGFKHLSPEVVEKGVGDVFGSWDDFGLKQTRLQVRNPENAPDDFEREMMQKLRDDRSLKEIWAEDELNGRKYFRYLMPMEMYSWCFYCHGQPEGELDVTGYPKEGFGPGDLGGVISISIPMDSFYTGLYHTAWRYLVMTVLLIISTLLTTFGVMTVMVSNPLRQLSMLTRAMGQGKLDVDLTGFQARGEIKSLAGDFNVMARQIKDMYNVLEHKVAERTRQLVDTNGRLREQQEKLYQMNMELVRANKLQSEFLANMSHELRTPLTSIIAFAELLLDQAAEQGEQEQAENLQDIMECSFQLLHMINDLLDMAKIEAGKMTLKLACTDLTEIAVSVEKTILPLARKKKIRLVNDIHWQLPLVMADPDRLRQVLLNLVGNAVKFTPEGGTVTLLAEVVDGQVVCSVQDTGIGISPVEQNVIFDKFRQADSSNTRSHPGTGLGLALVKHLVELHQGRIRVESTPGAGSIFSFALKIAMEDLPEAEEAN